LVHPVDNTGRTIGLGHGDDDDDIGRHGNNRESVDNIFAKRVFIPMSSVGTRLDNTSVRIAVSLLCLGAPLCPQHDCICGMAVDSTGVHGQSCRKTAGRGARDTAFNTIVKAALSAKIPSRLEPRGRARDDGKRPDGVISMP